MRGALTVSLSRDGRYERARPRIWAEQRMFAREKEYPGLHTLLRKHVRPLHACAFVMGARANTVVVAGLFWHLPSARFNSISTSGANVGRSKHRGRENSPPVPVSHRALAILSCDRLLLQGRMQHAACMQLHAACAAHRAQPMLSRSRSSYC